MAIAIRCWVLVLLNSIIRHPWCFPENRAPQRGPISGSSSLCSQRCGASTIVRSALVGILSSVTKVVNDCTAHEDGVQGETLGLSASDTESEFCLTPVS